MNLLLAIPILASGLASPNPTSDVERKLPELDAIKWYNTPALTMEALHGKTVLVEVFRTW